jgi:hypothetical protein
MNYFHAKWFIIHIAVKLNAEENFCMNILSFVCILQKNCMFSKI